MPDRINNNKNPIILAIESSCDDTAAAIISNEKIVSHVSLTQCIHAPYGGVVPELASRKHQANIVWVVDETLKKAQIKKEMLHAIAFTQGPGLLGSLLIGSCFAKAFSFSYNIPLIAVNHIHAHVLSNFIEDPRPAFPFLCLVVSGGHTQIILVKDYFSMEVIGKTEDDAVGEAFDKIAKIMGIPYPGGPLIDQYAVGGDEKRFQFPSAKMPLLNFSFSGIKTAFLYFVKNKKIDFVLKHRADVCASIQATLIHTLLNKLIMAVTATGITQIAIAGGVAANSKLRKELLWLGEKNNLKIFMPQNVYCTDNAAMVAITAHYHFITTRFVNLSTLVVPRMAL